MAKKGHKKIYRFLVKWEGYGSVDEVKDLGSSPQAKAMLEPLLANWRAYWPSTGTSASPCVRDKGGD
eukprot:858245-Pelagomonas_calceolata.AAC.3